MNKLLILLIFSFIFPAITFANGGDQRIVENKYFISLSRAPFTPRVGVKTSFLASFFDIQKNKLIAEDLIVGVRIAKQGDVRNNIFLFEKKDIIVQGGVLELPYTFTESGLHEIFFDFAFASNPQKIYEVPDFLIDVQKTSENTFSVKAILILSVILSLVFFVLGYNLGKHQAHP
ncbi:MAG: hypothetical protein Q8R55_03930 [Candidatus Taylorbacteria bacterium]|nr:hypothetical protein [Candidatus Taylorbacteria bacterium]